MCPFPQPGGPNPTPAASGNAESTCFSCTRLNAYTFKIVEDDQWSENPIIYVKIYELVVVLLDAGCGGASRDTTVSLTSLRQFLEAYPVSENNGVPLNQGGTRDYVVVCSHCHFDHIGGIAQFTDFPKSSIWASSYKESFIEGHDQLPTSSLCRFVGMETPTYTVSNWAEDDQAIIHKGENLQLQVFHTPGHTPDELALWDKQERVLYVGDTMYEWTHIIFPKEGNIIEYSRTIGKLKELVRSWNAEEGQMRVKIACGHNTYDADAEELIDGVDSLLYYAIQEWIESSHSETVRNEINLSFEREDGKLLFHGPARLFDEFRNDDAAVGAISARQS